MNMLEWRHQEKSRTLQGSSMFKVLYMERIEKTVFKEQLEMQTSIKSNEILKD